MPRLRSQVPSPNTGAPVEFDLCTRCAEDGDALRLVLSNKLAISVDPGTPAPVERVKHSSYDFQPRPTPCLSCARILSSEDD